MFAQLKSNFNVSRSGSSSACWTSSSLSVSSMSVPPSHASRWVDLCPTSKPRSALPVRYRIVICPLGQDWLLHTRCSGGGCEYDRSARARLGWRLWGEDTDIEV